VGSTPIGRCIHSAIPLYIDSVGLIRNLRRSFILKEGLIPDDEWAALLEDHPILAGLGADEHGELRRLSTLFLHEKSFEGADGMELTDYMKSVVALQACLPVLHLDFEWYRDWKSVVIVPDLFVESRTEFDSAGVAHEWDEDSSGESWDEGPVLLSWKDVEASGWGDGYNVVIHEAAHRLDLLDGKINGRPALHDGMDPEEWRRVFSAAFKDLSRRESGRKAQSGRQSRRRGKKSGIDSYAVENDGEFFAVVSEYFFEQPRLLKAEYPDVYRLLSTFYRQDPAARLSRRVR
jgi:Mlc titration factor MtfA (ptsG expression regulator)